MSELWYSSPSNYDWNKALPVGNGKLGAMIFGEKAGEHYQLNEDTVWFGKARNRNNKDAVANLEQLRKLIFEGEIPKAEELCKYAFSGTPQSQHSYQTLGDVYFDFCGRIGEVSDFKRKLDLSTAIHYVTERDCKTGVVFTRETFVSSEANCIMIRFSSSAEGALDLAASLQRNSFYENTSHTDDTLLIDGNLGGGGMDFCAGMCFVTSDVEVEGIGEHLVAKGATTIDVYLTACTEFRSENPNKTVSETLKKAATRSFEEWKECHISEYQSLFSRMSLELEYDKKLDKLPTDERRKRMNSEHPDQGLVNTYLDYGRYLLISSSRGDCMPANLQGIWNQDLSAPWGSKFTININTEMNYWPAEILNLSECHMPLFQHMKRMEPNGIRTAQEMYGCRGFVAHHNTDLWGDTAPQDIYIPATYWVMGGAWLCIHIWTHYIYTKDLAFLKEMYPLLKESVQFFMDFLVEDQGELVTCPSVSPENTYIMKNGVRGCVTAGATMDVEILNDLFDEFEKASVLVGEKDQEFCIKAKECRARFPKIKLGKYGQIMEWREDYEEAEPGHRHISHLWGLHPSHQITMDGTPELCEGARVTLKRRLANGGGHTGWSRAWIMNMYARLWDGEKCYQNLLALFEKSTLDNMLDNHPPFQIDGNFGAVAAIGEQLLQSSEKRTILLPALPKAWANGSVKGIRGVGNVIYSFSWKDSQLQELSVYAQSDYEGTICYGNKQKQIKIKEGETLTMTCSRNEAFGNED